MDTSNTQHTGSMNSIRPAGQRIVTAVIPYTRELSKLSGIAGPLILSSLVSMSVSIIDLTMMSWLGPVSLAAGAVASDYYSVFFYFFVGIIAAISALISYANGANNINAVREVTQTAFLLVLVFGAIGLLIMHNADIGLQLIGIDKELITTGLPYAEMMGYTFIALLGVNYLHYFLSAHGNTRAIFFASLISLPINAIGNYTLMFGNFGLPNMGLAGAGLSSFIASSVMFIFLLIIFSRKSYIREYGLLDKIKLNLDSCREIFRVGLPIGVSNLGEMGVFLLVTVLMGKFGAEAVAAHVIALRMAGIIYAVPVGYAQAATVRIGYVLGANQLEKLFVIFKTAMAVSLLVGFSYLLFISLYRFDITALFMDSEQISSDVLIQAGLFLLLLAISQPLECLGTVGSGILRGFKDTRSTMIFSMIAFWGVAFLGGNALAFHYGMAGTGLWLGLAGGSITFGLMVGTRLMWKWHQVNLAPARV